MTNEQMDELVNNHFMFEATNNIEGVLGTLADDIEHEMVGGPEGVLKGKENVRGFYERLFPELSDDSVQPGYRVYGDNQLVDETTWTGNIRDAKVFSLPGKSGRVSIRLLHVFTIRDGLIAKENVWFDFEAMKKQLG